jgi:hypothetical protein
MDLFVTIAEQKIREAIEKGEFDDLALKGRPINVENFSDIPEELRMGYKILKNAGMVPEELQLSKEILTLKDLVENCQNEEERKTFKKRLTEKTLRYNIMMEKNSKNPAFRRYASKIMNKLRL